MALTTPEENQPEEPVIYAGKFKTVEALEKGYKELNKSYTKKTQESASRKKLLEAAILQCEEITKELETRPKNKVYIAIGATYQKIKSFLERNEE